MTSFTLVKIFLNFIKLFVIIYPQNFMDQKSSVKGKIEKLVQSDYRYATYIRTLVGYFVYSSEEYKKTENLNFLNLKEYLLEILKKQISSFEINHANNEALFIDIFSVEKVDIKLLTTSKKTPEKLSREIENNIDLRVSESEEMLIDHEERITRIENEFLNSDKKYKDTYEFAVESFLDYIKKYLQKPTIIELEEFSEKYSNRKISKSEWSRNFQDPIFNSILEKELIKLINKTSILERRDRFANIFATMHKEFYDILINKIKKVEIHLEDMDPILQDKIINIFQISGQYEDSFPRTMLE